ncbi:hypothetical protein Q8791_20610 [Nocardiopsis sp. CT-R113]|uniref:Secreted protein n=1 Tax=Nocardiopsis codii TaxID=3065942 RepID=A0ABU7KBL0_9ACTN|nr:hypothetical protein [Nocardiopsis sp. CT-R113]MEE2039624.1 hypothetical protein [Nocardiopsis sp. CT-R113]
MNVTAKLGLYALGLVAVFAAAFGVGGLAGPVLPQEAPEHARSAESGDGSSPGGRDHTEDAEHGDGPSDATRDHEERQEIREGP